jgi:signal transduction histidine kinase
MGTWGLFPFVTNIASSELKALLLARIVYIAAIFTATTFWHFVRIIVGVEKERSEKIVIRVSYLISALFLFILFNPNFIEGVVRLAPYSAVIPGPFYAIFILFFGILCLDGFRMLLNVYSTLHGYKRNQIKYLFLGLSFAFIGGVMHFLAAYVRWEPFPHDFLIIAYSLIMTYAIVAHRLMDIEIVITRGIAYSAITAIIAGAYIGLMAAVDRIFGSVSGYNSLLAHSLLFIIVLFALIYVLPQMKIRAIEITRQTFFRGKYDYQKELLETSKEISTILNLEELSRHVVGRLNDIFHASKIAMLVLDEPSQQYVVAAQQGLDKELNTLRFSAQSDLVKLLKNTDSLLVNEEISEPGLKKSLSSIEAELCVPLMVKDMLVGMIFLSPKPGGQMYTQEDISLLTALASQLALTLEYIRTIEKLSDEKRYVGLGKASMRMAHDIKNPLVPIKTFLQLLPEKYPEEYKRMGEIDAEFTGRFYESALNGVERIDLLIQRALHYARHAEPTFSKVSLHKVIDDALTQEEVDIKENRVKLLKDYFSSDATIDADTDQLMELFSNLISNGVDAMQTSKIRTLTIATKSKNHDVIISISDTGCGIPQDRLNTLFDPFITYKHKGSGLGLAIVKKIVEDHNGKVEIASVENKGTTITVTLPKEAIKQS